MDSLTSKVLHLIFPNIENPDEVLIWKKLLNLSIYSCFIVFLSCCDQQNKESGLQIEKIKQYLKEQHDILLDKRTDRIYIINDKGCGYCIFSLSEFVKKKTNNNKALIIINSRGTNVDISGFKKKKQTNPHIIINHQPINNVNAPFYHSRVIYLKNEKIDTIINISDHETADQLKYIFKRKKSE